ncbi:DUF4870 domain-containing protein [bacterium]|nr:DUF4870 domain-containing protein [bacterium]
MKRVMPSFKDETDRLFIVGTLVASIFFMFIPSLLLVLFAKERMSESSYQIAKDIFNFELLLFLVSLIFMVPVIGWLIGFILGPIMIIFNVIIMVINLCAISENRETKIPVWYTFM